MLVGLLVVVLAMVSVAGQIAREALFVAPDLEADQLNLATMALVQHEPGVFGRDVTYGTGGDPSRFYTPWQVELTWLLWQVTGTPRAAFGAQLAGMALLSLVVAGSVGYWLTRRLIPTLLMATAATVYSPLAIRGEMWGVGPFHTAIPRTWASPFALLLIGAWVMAVERRDVRLIALISVFAGFLINLHPPTFVSATGVILLASFLRQLFWERRKWTGWGWWLAACAGAVLGSSPFVIRYATTATVAVPADPTAHLEAARYLIGQWIWPAVLDEVRGWVTVRPGESAVKLVPMLAAMLAALVLVVDAPSRPRLQALLLFGVALVVVSVIAPLVLQATLIRLGMSPMHAVDLLRGARLIAPLGVVAVTLAVARLLDRGSWGGLGAVCLAVLQLSGVYGPSVTLEFPSADLWAWFQIVGGVAIFLSLAGTHGLQLANRVGLSWAPHAVIVALLVTLPAGLIVAHALIGPGFSSTPLKDGENIATEELVNWAQTLAPDAVIDTSGVTYRTAMRLRLQSRHGITINLIDGAVLVYADGARAIEWHERMLRRDVIVQAGDFASLRALASEMGANVLVIERSVWAGALPDLAPSWENRSFVAYACC